MSAFAHLRGNWRSLLNVATFPLCRHSSFRPTLGTFLSAPQQGPTSVASWCPCAGDIRQTTAHKMDDQACVIRKGKFRHEFILVRSVFKKVVGGDITGHALVFEPRSLSKGRTGWEVPTGVSEVAPLLRTQGAQGIVIQALCVTRRGRKHVLVLRRRRPLRGLAFQG